MNTTSFVKMLRNFGRMTCSVRLSGNIERVILEAKSVVRDLFLSVLAFDLFFSQTSHYRKNVFR